jgi:hypothetical protein
MSGREIADSHLNVIARSASDEAIQLAFLFVVLWIASLALAMTVVLAL